MSGYDFKQVEDAIKLFWAKHDTYEKARSQGEKPFYFLDGPPYTSGKVHIGTAWNKVLKDLILRYKRMAGFKVWDRAGYDMHGLPTEHATEKELGIQGRKEIEEFGKEKFIAECRKLCLRNLKEMNKEFQHLGVWMDFANAYQTISKEWMEGEWWLIKKAHENGRLYEGERSMTWDMHAATALAKHELEYQTVTDTAIYVKFKLTEQDAYLVIWTTTPWTIPFNLAVMAGPSIRYCRVRVQHEGENQAWYIAKDLLEDFLTKKLNISYSVEEELSGEELAGKAYEHPFAAKNDTYEKLKENSESTHTVILSEEYVDTSAGTGLVHCAPGCGPEDYEVGHKYGIKPFNTIDQHGYCKNLDPFTGLRAKEQDDKFIELIEQEGALLHTHQYTHDYPFGERSKEPVIFRTTKQWFLKVEDMKAKLIEENNAINWIPDAAYNAFNAWLENLRDNSISRQRYWGTPLPIWRNTEDPDDYFVVASAKELAELSGKEEPEDLHMNVVDDIVVEKDGKTYKRVPDVLDVWVDAGTASWNCIGYPQNTEHFDNLYPADFILEGKDQIRGWFNLLHIASMVSMERPSFKACYMHGFVNDAQGRKMSKSLGNYILPKEVTEKYGVDATRYYMIGAANPGYDMNYNFEDLEVKYKDLLVFWNVHNYLLDMLNAGAKPVQLETVKLGMEEQYILAQLQETVRSMTNSLDGYRLNEAPGHIESFLLDLSRTYIQLTRDKANGTVEERQVVASVLAHCLRKGCIMLAPVVPYFAEQLWQNLRDPLKWEEESVHLCSWPKTEERYHNEQLLSDMGIAKDTIAAILAARDAAQLGVRWPVGVVQVQTKEKDALVRMAGLVLYQTNIKELQYEKVQPSFEVKPNYRSLGKTFGEETAEVGKQVKENAEALASLLQEEKPLTVGKRELLPEHLDITTHAPEPYARGESGKIEVYLDKTRTPALEREGFSREVVRRIQQLRKEAGMVKTDTVAVELSGSPTIQQAVEEHNEDMQARVGASSIAFSQDPKGEHSSTTKIKGEEITVAITKV